jgi:hypothetical protein
VLVLALHEGKIHFPDTAAAIEATPDWAKPLVEAALSERGYTTEIGSVVEQHMKNIGLIHDPEMDAASAR